MSDHPSDSDTSDLVARVALGDREAFDKLYAVAAPQLFPVAVAMLGDRHEAEEALQDGFVKIWQNADRFRQEQGAPFGWMSVIVRNAAIDRRRRMRDIPVEESFLQQVCQLPDPESVSIASNEARHLLRCLRELPEDEVRPLRRAFFGMRSYADVAKDEGVPVGTMKSRIRRSLKRIKACVEGIIGGHSDALAKTGEVFDDRD
ncbi:MAG: sigma-70 family RNA polymerase sigma factor [Parvularcula sp.]|nr:sigma-70 family RNA polymerase sigma factor [Parvularcula sp.]